MTSGVLYNPGQLFRTISLGDPRYQSDKTAIRVLFSDTNSTLVLTHALANELLVLLTQRLYDDGAMTRDTADRVNHLTNVVLMDPSEYAEIVAMHSGEDY